MFYFLTIRGGFGSPTPHEVEHVLQASGKPFETSQERSRWAMILSIVKEKRIEIDTYASMGTPDIGRINNHYYSFFPPMMSVFAIPMYLLGERFNATQLFTFVTPAFFALGTMILILYIGRYYKFHWSISLLSALLYGFATSAWGYSVTLFAHVASGFFLLLGIYLTIVPQKRPTLAAFGVWTSYIFAIYLDYPNAFIFLPIAITAFLQGFQIHTTNKHTKLSMHPGILLAPLVFVLGLGLYGYYNYRLFGKATTFSNTIPRVKDLKEVDLAVPETSKNAGQSLKTRNIVNGLYVFLFSPDRSVAIYTPAILLFVFGLTYFASRKHTKAQLLLVSVPATCFTLYTMFGDPWGGWAFGSRYLVAIMPELIILAGAGLQQFNRNIWIKILYSIVVIYSSASCLLAPLTTNVIPPLIEAYGLGIDYTYIINWNMLKNNNLDSFAYNNYFHQWFSGMQYYGMILGFLALIFLILIWIPKYEHTHTK